MEIHSRDVAVETIRIVWLKLLIFYSTSGETANCHELCY